MNIPMSWLKAIIPIEDTAEAFAEKITNAGMAVEAITQPDAEISGVVVGQIKSLTRHPDADRLWVTQTDIGSEVLQICTAADNLKEGDYVPVAVHGANLANGLKIKKSKMRGQESNGMLVSVEELGYTRDDYPEAPEDGIYVFSQAYSLGIDAKPIFGLDEAVLEFDILSNRPDCNAVIGIAREAAALYSQPFVAPAINVKEEGPGHITDYVTVDVQDTDRCPRYIARVVTDVVVGPSPSWLRRRLNMAGIRPINNIVDITNYVMVEYGQPLHAFDINTVARMNEKYGVVVRTAADGDKFTTLDGEERTLTESTLMIADYKKPIGIAGIMGGDNSCITDNTKTILFESANFDSANIRLSARKLGMRTDASGRYEKGLDPNLSLVCVNRAMELIEELGCGKVVPGMVDVYPNPRTVKTIAFTPKKIKELLGIETLSANDICAYLTRVGIETRPTDTNGEYMAIIPTHRADISGSADLAEEVARFYGHNNIPSRYVQRVDGKQESTSYGPSCTLVNTIKDAAVALGYYEAKTFPFDSVKVFDKLLLPDDHKDRNAMVIRNPLGEDMGIMRTLSLNGLLESLGRNDSNSNESAYLFELARTYHPNKEGEDASSPYEPFFLTLAAFGPDMDFLSIKGDVEEILAALNVVGIGFARHQLPFTHPGKTALIQVLPGRGQNHPPAPIGYIGELHPQVCENYQINKKAYIAVLCMEALGELALGARRFKVPSIFPALTRDIALVVPEAVTAAEVELAIRERGGSHLEDVKLFDVYQGKQIAEGYKSMAYALRFRANDRTLADKDVQKPLRLIVDNLTKKLGAEVRDAVKKA
ncbi:MAG: phenylalanine--tRNA ligase subunit beta [Defluviitaleaceae bacterium]|nr:phenylalanine--tRNA ligase subunit beta [Defluviitaleaceae bacterium]